MPGWGEYNSQGWQIGKDLAKKKKKKKKKRKGVQGRLPWSKEVLKEGSDTKQYVVLGRLSQAMAVMGTVSNRQAKGTELFSH